MWRNDGAANHSGGVHVRDCFRRHAEKGGSVAEANVKGKVKSYESLIPFLIFMNDKGGQGHFLGVDPQVHVRVYQVYLAEVD